MDVSIKDRFFCEIDTYFASFLLGTLFVESEFNLCNQNKRGKLLKSSGVSRVFFEFYSLYEHYFGNFKQGNMIAAWKSNVLRKVTSLSTIG